MSVAPVAIDPDDPHLVGVNSDTRRHGPAIQLSSGARFRLLSPDPALMTPEVIAGALSKLCRFTGHTRSFYSVAQHCVMVSRLVQPELALEGLLHDASEAFCGDLSRPLKLVVRDYAGVEDGIQAAVARRYGTGHPHDPAIKVADNVALAAELRDLFDPTEEYHRRQLPRPPRERISPLGPYKAERQWLARYRALAGESA